jgi:hypothetical protein
MVVAAGRVRPINVLSWDWYWGVDQTVTPSMSGATVPSAAYIYWGVPLTVDTWT